MWPAALAAGLVALLLAAPAGAAPNVVVIETDDQTAESMRVMTRTQALLGLEGTTFANSFVSLSLCCPSRATLLTGRYAHNHGVRDIKPPYGGYEGLDHSETLAVWLQRAGYATVHLGKYLNHYGRRNPLEVPGGWSEWHGLVDPSTYSYYRYVFNDDGVLHKYGRVYQTDVITERAEEIVSRRAASPQPFFLYVGYLAPHNGLPREPGDPPGMPTPVAAPRHAGAFAGTSFPRVPSFDEWDVRDKPRSMRRPWLTWAKELAIDSHYRQELESLLAVDEGVERIVEALRRSGELEDTLIVFTSDNGFMHGEHRIPSGKVVPYEPSIRVPLLMRGPGVPRGVRADRLAANVDLAPTIMDVTGAQAPWAPDGLSLLSPAAPRDILLEGPARKRDGAPRFAGLRTQRYKYVRRITGAVELYDLARDPHELRNLAGRRPGLEARMALRLARLRTCAGASCLSAPARAAQPRRRARSRATGARAG